MKVTLITATRNSAKTLPTAIESVLSQKGVDVEYLVVDGDSSDGTVVLLKTYEPRFNGRMLWISEPDKGMYDAINKGIKMATGDVVGILNADDVLASDDTLAHIAASFSSHPSSPIPHPQRIDALCADFELELRFLGIAKLRSAYLPECIVVMRMGGASTSGWRSNVEINREDLRALRSHGIWSCLPLIYLKYLFKIWGFVFKRR